MNEANGGAAWSSSHGKRWPCERGEYEETTCNGYGALGLSHGVKRGLQVKNRKTTECSLSPRRGVTYIQKNAVVTSLPLADRCHGLLACVTETVLRIIHNDMLDPTHLSGYLNLSSLHPVHTPSNTLEQRLETTHPRFLRDCRR